jgi:hypothetical protein
MGDVDYWLARLQAPDEQDYALCCESLGLSLKTQSEVAEAGRRGAVTATLAALRLHAADARVQAAGWHLIARVCLNDDNVGSAGAAGAITDVLTSLRTHTSDVDVLLSACAALRNLTVSHGALAVTAERLGAVSAVVAALRAHPTHAGLAEQGCAALSCLAAHEAVSRGRWNDVHVTIAVVSALNFHVAHHVTVKGCCKMMSDVGELASVAGKLCDAGAINAVVRAMRMHAATEELQLAGCLALDALLRKGLQAHTFGPADAGVLEAVALTFRTHGSVLRVVHLGCSALYALFGKLAPQPFSDGGAPSSLFSVVLHAVVSVLRRHRADVRVQHIACWVISALARLSNDQVDEGGAVEAVLGTLQAQPHVNHVEDVVWRAIANLARMKRTAADKAEAAGAIPLVVAAVRVAREQVGPGLPGELLRNPAVTALRNLCVNCPGRVAKAVAADAVEALVAVLRTSTYDSWGGFETLHALILKSDEAARRAIKAGALQLSVRCDTAEAVRARTRVHGRLQSLVAAAESAAAELLAAEEVPRASAATRKKKPKKRGAAAQTPATATASAAATAAVAADASPAEQQPHADATAAHQADRMQHVQPPEPAAAADSLPQNVPRGAAASAAPPLTVLAVADSASPDAAVADAADCARCAAAAKEASAEASAEALSTRLLKLQLGASAADAAAATAPAAPAAPLPPLPVWLLAHRAPQPPQPEAAHARVAALTAQLAESTAALATRTAALAAQEATNKAQATALAKMTAAKKALEEAATCVICLDAPRCTALLPCRHWLLCASPGCAAMLGAPPLCPVCRERVADTLQLFV